MFDLMHSSMVDCITLSMWMYNPIIWKVMPLASMACKSEDIENMVLFQHLFLEVLHKVKKLHKFMVDENDRNK